MITLKIAIKDNIIEIILHTNSNYVSYHDLSNKEESHTLMGHQTFMFFNNPL